jgi:hypothetical protein
MYCRLRNILILLAAISTFAAAAEGQELKTMQ